jgi:hypothetical protein
LPNLCHRVCTYMSRHINPINMSLHVRFNPPEGSYSRRSHSIAHFPTTIQFTQSGNAGRHPPLSLSSLSLHHHPFLIVTIFPSLIIALLSPIIILSLAIITPPSIHCQRRCCKVPISAALPPSPLSQHYLCKPAVCPAVYNV